MLPERRNVRNGSNAGIPMTTVNECKARHAHILPIPTRGATAVATRIGRRGLFLAIAIGATALTAACMTANGQQQGQNARPAGHQCFNVSMVNGFNAIDKETVQVTVGVNTVYELKLLGTCPDIDWSLKVGIRSTSGSSWVCDGLDAELLVPSPIGVQHCPVTAIRQLTPEEVKASKATRKP
jgi:hypothetical protein